MTRRSRRIIFYTFLVLFPIIGIAVVLYAQGWRIDPATFRVGKVGAVLVRPYPTGVAITLDGKPVRNQANLLSQSTLISNLAPGNYNLELSAPGYTDWHENVAVLPSLVTEFRYAVLVPSAPEEISTNTITDYFVASGELVARNVNGAIRWRGETIGAGTIVGESAGLGSVAIHTPLGNYFLYNFSAATSTNISAMLSRAGANLQNISDIMVDPLDSNTVIAKTARAVWLSNVTEGTTTLADIAPAAATIGKPLAASQTRIAWTYFEAAQNKSMVALYDPFSKTTATSSQTVAGAAQELAWLDLNRLGVLQNDGSLYIYDAGARTFQKIADDVKQFSVAPDGSAIAALENKSLEIFPFADPQTYHRFNLPNAASALRLIWYKDATHLFVVYPGTVAFLDVDDLGLRNLQTVGEGTDPLYSQSQNIFYLINPQGNLEWFDFPN